MDAHLNDLPGEPGYGESGRDQSGSPRPAGLVGLLGSVPLRQLAGPAAVFFFWPPTHTRPPSPGRRRTPPGDPGRLQQGAKPSGNLVAQASASFSSERTLR